MTNTRTDTLDAHLKAVKKGGRRFENAFEAISRMILEGEVSTVVVNGQTTYDFGIFRDGPRHIIGMYHELNSFASYVKDAAEGGSSGEMAYVLVGEPGNGKTFFVDYLCHAYRSFLGREGNRRYTFQFHGMDELGGYGRIAFIESQTYEDPMILAHEPFGRPGGKQGLPGLPARVFPGDYRRPLPQLPPHGSLQRLCVERYPCPLRR